MKTDRILRSLTLAGIFLIPVIPLIMVNTMFFPFITGKNFAFRIIVEIIAVLWIILALRNSEYRPKSSLVFKSIFLFVVIIGIADIFSANPFKSFWSNFERMEGWVTIFHLFMYFVVAGSMLPVMKLWTRFLQLSVAVSVIEIFYGFLQIMGKATIHQGGVRLDGTFGNASYLAIYMLFHIFITAFLLLRERWNKPMQWTYGVIMLLQFYILLHTASRGVTLGLLVGIFVSLIIMAFFEKERLVLKKWSRIALAAAVVVVVAFIGLRQAPFIKSNPSLERIASISFKEATARFNIWSMAIEGFKERPILGWGQESFNFVFNKYYDPKLYTQEQWFDRSHNVFFDWLIAGGVLGLLSYLSIFLAFLLCLWRDELSKFSFMAFLKRRSWIPSESVGFSTSEKALLTGLVAGYFFQNLFVFDNIGSYILFFSLLAMIHTFSTQSWPHRVGKTFTFEQGTVNRIIVPLVLIVGVFSLYFFNYRAVMASKTLIQALATNDANKRYDLLVKTISYNSFGNAETREQIVQSALEAGGSNAPVEVKQKYFDLAQSEMQKQIALAPGDARFELFLGSFLSRFGRYDEAIVHLNKSLENSPNKQSIMFEIGSVLIAKGQYAEAMKMFKKAYDLAPTYTTARDLYAISAIYAKEDKVVEDLLVPAYGSVLVPDDRFIKAYFDTKQTDKVLAIWKIRAKDSTNFQAYVGLAAAYLAVNDRPNAIVSLQKAIELNPDFKTQGESYISEIRAGRNP